MARQSTPAKRASEGRKTVSRVRRKYKADLNRRRRLSPGEEPAIAFTCVVLKLAGYSNIQIGQVVGISKGQVKVFLETPEAVELLIELRAKIPAAALELLHGYMIEAVQAVVDVMRKSPDDKMVLAAASEILDRGGMPKTSRQEKKSDQTQTLNVTDDGLLDRLREAPPEVQEHAAQIVEDLEKMLSEHAQVEDEVVDDQT